MQELSEEQRDAVRRVEKLLALAARAGTPEEAAAAATKAQQMLEAYNLSMGAIEEAQGATSGKREEMKQKGGMFLYERQLWRQVADLNFCIYLRYKEPYYRKDLGRMAVRYNHKLVGRVVNTRAAAVPGSYLQGAVEKLCRERLHDRGEGNAQFFSSWAVSFREGAVDEIVWRLYDKRKQRMAEEEAKIRAEAERAKMAGTSTATGLTLRRLADQEYDANADFIMGEGWSAKKAAERAEQARLRKEADDQYAAWAAAHPEEARREEAKRQKERERRDARPAREERKRNRDWGAYRAGSEAGKSVGIDPQVSTPERKRIGSS